MLISLFFIPPFLSFAASLTVAGADINNNNITNLNESSPFEYCVISGLHLIRQSVSSDARQRIVLYNLAALAPAPGHLTSLDPAISIVRVVDPYLGRLYTARSPTNPPRFDLSSRLLTKQDPGWLPFQWPQDLMEYDYEHVVSVFREYARVEDLTACRVGVPPIDPFRSEEGPSVLWICNSPSAPNGEQWVLKARNGFIRKFPWSSMGLDTNGVDMIDLDTSDMLLGNSSSANTQTS